MLTRLILALAFRVQDVAHALGGIAHRLDRIGWALENRALGFTVVNDDVAVTWLNPSVTATMTRDELVREVTGRTEAQVWEEHEDWLSTISDNDLARVWDVAQTTDEVIRAEAEIEKRIERVPESITFWREHGAYT